MNTSRGFSLLELLIAIAVISILTAISVPKYADYTKQAKIPQATSKLATLRVQLEQYYQDNKTYLGACAASTLAPLPEADSFTYSCPTLNATEFVAQASGSGPMTGFTYTINQDGTRATTAAPTGWGTAPISCWVTKKGGSC